MTDCPTKTRVAGRARPRARRRRRASTASSARRCAGCRRRSRAWSRGRSRIQYPEEKTPVYPRFRGRHKLHRFEDTGLEKCVGCSLCAAACPAECIRVVAAENTPDNQVSAGERYAAVYEINMTRCIFCGYCEVACPFDAITMGNDYELADYDALRPDLHEGDAARRPARAHAAAARRASRHRPMWFEQVLLLRRRRSARSAGALGVVLLRNPFYSRARAGRAPARAGGAVPAAARRVPRGRAGRRLRGRGDGALRVRGRLRRRRRRAAAARGRRCVDAFGPLFAAALWSSSCRSRSSAPASSALDTRGRRRRRRLRLARRRSAQLLLTRFLIPFEAASYLLLVAAVGAVVLARRRRGLEERRPIGARRAARPRDAETLEVSV